MKFVDVIHLILLLFLSLKKNGLIGPGVFEKARVIF